MLAVPIRPPHELRSVDNGEIVVCSGNAFCPSRCDPAFASPLAGEDKETWRCKRPVEVGEGCGVAPRLAPSPSPASFLQKQAALSSPTERRGEG